MKTRRLAHDALLQPPKIAELPATIPSLGEDLTGASIFGQNKVEWMKVQGRLCSRHLLQCGRTKCM